MSPYYVKMIDLHSIYRIEEGQVEICNIKEGHAIRILSPYKEGVT